MTISNESIKAAADKIHAELSEWYPLEGVPGLHGHCENLALYALEAAAPIIRAECLEEAAGAMPFMRRPVTRLIRHKAAADWLRARAVAERGEG